MNCETFERKLPDLILNSDELTDEDREHVSACAACEMEYTSITATLAVMDAWEAPEPSVYFDQKLAVLLREEQRAPRLGFLGRLRDHILFSTGRQFRPAVAGALGLVIMLGGGSYVGLQRVGHPVLNHQISATVTDLQILDKNEPALQQMDQLLQDDDSSRDATSSDAPS